MKLKHFGESLLLIKVMIMVIIEYADSHSARLENNIVTLLQLITGSHQNIINK